MSDKVLSVKGLHKSYRKSAFQKKVDAVKGISFDVFAGQVTGFLGANGAGKTTTLKCLLELAFADKGEIEYFGQIGLSAEAKTRIGFLPERPYFYEYLTGREFLKFYGQIAGMKRVDLKERAAELLKRVGLEQAADRPLRGYSKGMLQRIGIAQALIHRPNFIILDEPMTGLDPDGRFEIREIIRSAAQNGTAVFFSSHLLPDAETLCSRLVILKQGNLVYEGETSKLLRQVQNGQMITFAKDGTTQNKIVPTVAELQTAIDSLRREGAEIREVRPDTVNLEEAFMKLAFDKTSDSKQGELR